MFKRRIQVMSGSTYMVSLPKDWARLHNLKQHDEVVIEILPDLSLKISPVQSRRSFEKSYTFYLSGLRAYDMIQLVSAYLAGYDEVKINCGRCSADYARSVVRELINKTIGLEIVETSQFEYVVKNVAGDFSIGVDEIILRVFRILKMMLQDLSNALAKEAGRDVYREIAERDSLVDKLTLYGLRVFNKVFMGEILPKDVGFKSFAEVNVYYNILRNLERTVDHVAILARDLGDLDGRLDERVREATLNHINTLADFCDKVMNLYASKSGKDFSSLLNVEYENVKKAEETSRRMIASNPNYFFIYDNLYRVRGYLLDIVELVSDIKYLTQRLQFEEG
ncbi:phosphate signaling complex PhoU family protein [Thermogladius calderae]|uniref:phosphate signaling complex PhoU family protein n=1 Tax=Thermogladius calderae TaxID=1200300 RepID=UPI00064E5ADE|nr:phosphate uptake regulator PhoU [Thermogladius calderae]